ncbi:MAG: hypothetical protein GQ547_08605 [Methylophaga sp.]|nr:hypothetical protein [Methylophaga sp.]
MPKYFKTSIEVTSVFQTEIMADDEESAKSIARKTDVSTLTPVLTKTSSVSVKYDGECNFNVGTEVNHDLFGHGE